MRALVLALFLVACGADPAPECTYDSQCGELAICQDPGVCVSVECLESKDCPTGTYCSEANTCDPGCGADRDCDAGMLCNVESHTCETYGCRTTELDCALGQYCDPADGKCKQDDRGHCDSCDVAAQNTCGGNSTCVAWELGDTCGNDNHCEDGWYCDSFYLGTQNCHRDVCLIQCDPNAELTCPRGLSCIKGVLYDEPNKAYCYGDCVYLKENGFL